MTVPFDSPVSMDFHADTTQPPLLVCVVPIRLASGTLEMGVATAPDGRMLLMAEPAITDSLDMTAQRLVTQASGRPADYLEQLYTFSPRSGTVRQVVITYIALFREHPGNQSSAALNQAAAPDFAWMPRSALRPARYLDHTVFDYALVRLRAKFGYTSIAFHLLPVTFTLTDLQQAYEAVLGHAVDKRNFRRRMSLSGILADTGEQRRDGSHRPAALYRFATRDDQAAYLTPSWASERPSSRSGEPE